MSKSEDTNAMSHSFKIWIPTRCFCKKDLPDNLRGEVLQEVKRTLSQWFGGFNLYHLESSGYVYEDGTLEEAPCDVVEAFATQESFDNYYEDFVRMAADVAWRLTQECLLISIDNTPKLYAPTKPITAQNCAHTRTIAPGVEKGGPLPTSLPLRNVDKLNVIRELLRSFKSADHARKLFCGVLKYHSATGELPCATWPIKIRTLLTDAPTLLADHNGFKILYLRIAAGELRRGAGRQVILRIHKDDPTFRGLIVVSDKPQKSWDLVNVKVRGDDSKRLLLRRMRVGVEAIRTMTERMATLEIGEAEDTSITAEELQSRHDKAFDVEAVTKQFFSEVANWYFWALKHAKFPKDAPKEKDGYDHVSVIRLITRLVFCWFVKEKGLIPADLFNERKLADLLVGFAPRKISNKDSVFYKAILQNLFFATLNTEMAKRDWRRNGQNFMAHSLYRYSGLFIRPNEALALFKNIPFLNGGLFECLDKILGDKTNPRYERIDGFSDRDDSQPTVPDFLFFGEERELDLSEDYGDKKFRKVKVRGLIHTLNHYRFTIEESTPLEEEVALDPELAGKIFENLLAAYNPETGATARKQTGSFYTPREIVNYMVDEALIAYLKGKIEESPTQVADVESRLRHLFSFEAEGHRFVPKEVELLIAGIDQLKTLDPAVGSGAFPMGILHKLVFILGRLDPNNEMWKERQKQRLRDAGAAAELIEDATIRESTLSELEKQIAGIEEAFEKNTLDYGRKLFLIENCLYGVDIQPIAVQIAKMRFFISLIADQRVDLSAENLGVRPLPNLETKLVAANTLIAIDKPKQMTLRNPRIDALAAELRRVRERHFLARTPTSKAKCREQDQKLRVDIAELLKKDGWDNATAKQLAGWDPYDQNASSGFFDPEWMFGVREGFDVVMGNPPYISHDKLMNKNILKDCYSSYEPFADIYCYFIEIGIKLLASRGILDFITSNSYLRAEYGLPLRRWIRKNSTLSQIINIEETQVFESAIVNVAIMIAVLGHAASEFPCRVVNAIFEGNQSFSDFVQARGFSCPQATFDSRAWNLTSTENLALQRKIESKGASLDRLGAKIRLGLATGYNDAFVIDENKRKELINANFRSKEIIRPILRGRDISRYSYTPSGLYILLTKNGVDVRSEYPEVFKHLNSFGDAVRKRGAHGSHWSNLRACAFLEDFKREKIIWIELADVGRFALCSNEVYLLNSAYFMIVPPGYDVNYVLGILNSRIIRFYLNQIAETSGMGTSRWINNYVKEFPIPSPSQKQAPAVINLVTRIITAKMKNPAADTIGLEGAIDAIVYELYGLTKDEIKIVEGGR